MNTTQRNYFYVYQNKTYDEERSGGFLWSPKYARGWTQNAGYETMKQVQPGDIIFHSYRGEIVAVSIARSACYSSPRPSGAFSEWANDGWKIDTSYHILNEGLKVAPYIPELYTLQPTNGPYTSAYRGKQQYLCNANKALFDYLLDKIIKAQHGHISGEALLNFLQTEKPVALSDEGVAAPRNTSINAPNSVQELIRVVDGCEIDAFILEQKKNTHFVINVSKFPAQKVIIGKQAGEVFTLRNIPLHYQIKKIYR